MPTQLVEFAKQLAKERELDHIRADTNADESKLRQIYQDLGFELAGIEKEDDRNTAYYQIKLT